MATVQKSISESSSYTTTTLSTTISAPGIKQNADIAVSAPGVSASNISYTVNEAAETIKVVLSNVSYSSSERIPYPYTATYYLSNEYTVPDSSGTGYYRYCVYEDGSTINAGGGQDPGFPAPACPAYHQMQETRWEWVYYFSKTVTVTYSVKTFPEFAVRQGGQLKSSVDGWVRVNGQLKQIQQMWVRVNGQLKEI